MLVGKGFVEDKFDAPLLGVDLQRGVEGFAFAGQQSFGTDGAVGFEVAVLFVGEHEALDFAGDHEAVCAEGDDFVRLRVDRDVGGERFALLRGQHDERAQVAGMAQGGFFFLGKRVPHEREVEARLFAQGVDGEAGAAVFGAAERQAGVGVDFSALEGDGDGEEAAFLPTEHAGQIAGLFEAFARDAELFQGFPIDRFGVDGGGEDVVVACVRFHGIVLVLNGY